ncbi:MAG: hypothetical protein B6244_07590 [Candidatus Cloacimonetes bacterium 4572_55]|nr:MAG: hypothetical protein B6244_07590 [Candidatus Cloacimonetes bacterium 4572_55]
MSRLSYANFLKTLEKEEKNPPDDDLNAKKISEKSSKQEEDSDSIFYEKKTSDVSDNQPSGLSSETQSMIDQLLKSGDIGDKIDDVSQGETGELGKPKFVSAPPPNKPSKAAPKNQKIPQKKGTMVQKPPAKIGSSLKSRSYDKPASKSHSDKQCQLVCFQLGGEEYAIDILDVQEINETKNIRPIPSQPSYILGLTKVRNRTIPVVDLAAKMGLRMPKSVNYPFLMIVFVNNEIIALAVEYVTEVRSLEQEVLEVPPSLPKSGESDFFGGVYVIKGKLLIILRVEKIMTTAEIVDLSQTIKSARASFFVE